ncbi:restriction endonuclease subunit S [Staphylococcus equorum]|uniref:restriction endonuclease subunit S n=1 Tax=Staphylococcus equorum TaxID=246432 RepID=UPI003EBF466B
MTNEVKNVPKLRFQRFEDEWKKKRLKDIVEPLKGNSGENKNLPVLTISAKKGWLNQKERFSQVIAGNSLSKYNELKKGDLSYNKGNSKVALYGIVYKLGFDNALVPNVYKSFRPKPNNVSDFLEKYFHTKILDRQLRRVITSTARMDGLLNISDYDFYNMSLNIPVNNEQKKIGDFFSKLDQQIELEEQKLAKLEEQKKGYMQKVFSQELRFKDENGKDYPKWDEKKLEEVTNYNSSKRSSNHYKDLNNSGSYPVYDANKEIFRDEYFDMEQAYISILKDGAGVGRLNIRGERSSVIGTMGYITAINIDLMFLYYRLTLIKFKKYIIGSTIPHLYYKDYSSENLGMPIKEEQQKIGDFFKKIDELIEKEHLKIDELKERKKGFLQKMFV